MITPYEAIKALPGKGTDWTGLVCALEAHYREVYVAVRGQEPAPVQPDDWYPAGSVLSNRYRAQSAGTWSVREFASRSKFIPPSPETLEWGGFLGGETVAWSDDDAEEAETARVLAIIQRYAP